MNPTQIVFYWTVIYFFKIPFLSSGERVSGIGSIEAMLKKGGDSAKRYFSDTQQIKVAQGVSGTVVDKGAPSLAPLHVPAHHLLLFDCVVDKRFFLFLGSIAIFFFCSI